ncbi:hypothetical protein [Streptomyces sp. NPDC015125]|uniref:hypothetical protein n=1 Tax=Streptomyces sp. NPDC015125 TaxID=3364938 RepID=UPI0036FFC325
MHANTCVEVDCRALEVHGLASLRDVRLDGVIHLSRPTLQMAAGHWQVGAWQYEHDRPSGSRILEPITDAEAVAYAARARPHRAHRARRPELDRAPSDASRRLPPR